MRGGGNQRGPLIPVSMPGAKGGGGRLKDKVDKQRRSLFSLCLAVTEAGSRGCVKSVL